MISAAPRAVAAPGGTHNLPAPPCEELIGREAEFEQLDQSLLAGQPTVVRSVTGLGGVGKTTLALHYAHARRRERSLTWWVTASTPRSVEQGLALLTEHLLASGFGTLGRVSAAEAAEWATAWLQTHEDWLLVLDDVDRPATVEPLIGRLRGQGRIVITSRHDTPGARTLPLMPLARAASLHLLTAQSARAVDRPGEASAADAVADFLGDLPLALSHAAAYVRTRKISYSKYLGLLENDPGHLLDKPLDETPQHRPLTRTWTVTMTSIAAADPLAAAILGVAAWYAPVAIPRALFAPLAGDDPAAVDDALALLDAYSMITLEEETFSVHSLVQLVSRTAGPVAPAPTPSAVAGAADIAVQLLHQAVPADHTSTDRWEIWRPLVPHIQTLASRLPAAADSARSAELWRRTAMYLVEDNPDRDAPARTTAIDHSERALTYLERAQGPDARRTLHARRQLAWLRGDAEAVRSAGERLRAALGEYDPASLIALHDEGWQAAAAGDHTQAEQLFRRAKSGQQTIPSEIHNLFATEYGLGYVLHRQGRLAEAESVLDNCAQRRSASLGAEHPHTLATFLLLAKVLASAERNADARSLAVQILDAQIRVLPADHPMGQETRALIAALDAR